MSFDAELGPIDFVVVVFESTTIPAAGFTELEALADAGRVRVIDLEFIAKDDAGTVTAVDIADLTGADGFDLAAFEGANSGLLSGEDLAVFADDLRPGQVAAVVIYEELSFLSAIAAWRGEGAAILSEGVIELDELVEALDAATN